MGFLLTIGEKAARSDSVLSRVAAGAILLAFLAVFMQPVIVNPFELDQATAWVVVCYAFAGSVLAVRWRRVIEWQPTPFDYALVVYLAFVVVAWPASVDRQTTSVSIFHLLGQVAVYVAVRAIVTDSPALGEMVIAAMIIGIAVLEWMALDYRLRFGLSESRLEFFPPLEWNGRAGLGALSAVEFALLIGIGQSAPGRIRTASMILMAGLVVEMILLYARLPWVAALVVLAAASFVSASTGTFRRFVAIVGTTGIVAVVVGRSYALHLIKLMVGLEHGVEGGIDIRSTLWRNALRIIRDHPLAGVGLGNYPRVHQQLFFIPLPATYPELSGVTHPHNLFLQQTAELALAGGLAYATQWGVALWLAWRAATSRPAQALVGAGLFYMLLALVVINMGENVFLEQVSAERVRLHTVAWIAIGLAVAPARVVRARAPAEIAAGAPAQIGPA